MRKRKNLRVSAREFEKILSDLELKCEGDNTSLHIDLMASNISEKTWSYFLLNHARNSQLQLFEDDAEIEISSVALKALRNEIAHGRLSNKKQQEIYEAALSIWRSRLKNSNSTKILNRPPKSGLYVLELVCSTENRDAIVGDLLEAYEDIQKQYGYKRARIWFWWQLARSIYHLAWPAIKRLGLVSSCVAGAQWVLKKFN